jgi:hypothetical protein
MNTTSSQLPICVHCGTPRPADETLCPTCGKPWVDTTIQSAPASDVAPPAVAAKIDTSDVPGTQDDGTPTGAVAAAGAVTAAAHVDKGESATPAEVTTDDGSDSGATDGTDEPADGAGSDANDTDDTATDAAPVVVPPPPPPLGPDDTGEFAFNTWIQPPEDEGEGRSKAWLVPAGIIAAILAAVAFLVFGGSTTTTTTTIAALSTTSASVTTTSASVTTTTQITATTVIAYPQPEDWPPTGEPIDIDELTLKQAAIGPIDTGTPIDDVAGALTASLGEATASGIDDLCPPDESYWLAFGQLTAIFDGFDNGSVLVSYRYNEPGDAGEELGLTTLSGIAIGDTVEDLIDTYTQFTISFEIIDSKDHFRLSDGGELLLWGPVSSIDPAGLIEGIYSPTACDATP